MAAVEGDLGRHYSTKSRKQKRMTKRDLVGDVVEKRNVKVKDVSRSQRKLTDPLLRTK
jgi:hypothetical protein